jgi:HPt (histidine-containing phosphotransfer) domain-containing protein
LIDVEARARADDGRIARERTAIISAIGDTREQIDERVVLFTEQTDGVLLLDLPVINAEGEVVDLTVLATLTRNNAKKMREIATVFVTFMDRTLGELDAAVLAGDRAALSALGHKSKSSAGAVGARGLSQLCQRLETSMKQPDADMAEARALVDEMHGLMGLIAAKFESAWR